MENTGGIFQTRRNLSAGFGSQGIYVNPCQPDFILSYPIFSYLSGLGGPVKGQQLQTRAWRKMGLAWKSWWHFLCNDDYWFSGDSWWLMDDWWMTNKPPMTGNVLKNTYEHGDWRMVDSGDIVPQKTHCMISNANIVSAYHKFKLTIRNQRAPPCRKVCARQL